MTTPTLDRFSTAAGGGQPDATPIWFMRQAGRVLPRYRQLRERYDFETLSSDPALTAEVTLLPLEVLPVDAAILFADLMTPLAAMDIEYRIVEGVGPVVADPLTSADGIGSIDVRPTAETIPALFEAIKLIRKELAGGIPLIGFAGAPFTIASYLIEGRGSRDLAKTKRLMFSDKPAWQMLMGKLTDLLIDYLSEQVNAGVQAFQLFDSWVGVLSPHDYRENVLPFSRRIFAHTDQLGVPRIHFGTGTATLLADMASAGAEVLGIDWRVPLDQARQTIGSGVAVQGNLDPAVVLTDQETIRDAALDVLRRAGAAGGHIFNLGHGLLPDTPLDNIKFLVDLVHEETMR